MEILKKVLAYLALLSLAPILVGSLGYFLSGEPFWIAFFCGLALEVAFYTLVKFVIFLLSIIEN